MCPVHAAGLCHYSGPHTARNATRVAFAAITDLACVRRGLSLGGLAWCTIREVELSRDGIKERLVAAGLDEGFTSKPVLTSDAFRRATSEAERLKVEVSASPCDECHDAIDKPRHDSD